MMNLQIQSSAVLFLVLLAMGAPRALSNFHVMNTRAGQFYNLNLLPSNNFQYGAIEQPIVGNSNYPKCHGGAIYIPNGQCGWSGVRIQPACSGTYFGKVIDASNEDQGYCYWKDQGEKVDMQCGS